MSLPRLACLALLPLVVACGLYFPNSEDDTADDGGVEADDVFIAVGDAGALLSSPDGVTWTVRTSGLGIALQDVAFGVDRYIAVGQAGKILNSSNGLDWLSASSPSSRDLNAVVHHGDRFFAVGGDYSAGAETLVSADGATWTRPELPGPQHVLTDLASDGVTLVALGSYQADLQTFGLFVWSDTAGWQQVIDAGTSGTRYAAVAAGIPEFALIGTGVAASSNDTTLWTPTPIVAAPPMHALVYTALGWIAVGDGGGVLTSGDARQWASHATPATVPLRAVTTSGSQFIAVGDSGVILSSTDGAGWISVSSPLTVNLKSVVHPRE